MEALSPSWLPEFYHLLPRPPRNASCVEKNYVASLAIQFHKFILARLN